MQLQSSMHSSTSYNSFHSNLISYRSCESHNDAVCNSLYTVASCIHGEHADTIVSLDIVGYTPYVYTNCYR